jgi:hypothetical protein
MSDTLEKAAAALFQPQQQFGEVSKANAGLRTLGVNPADYVDYINQMQSSRRGLPNTVGLRISDGDSQVHRERNTLLGGGQSVNLPLKETPDADPLAFIRMLLQQQMQQENVQANNLERNAIRGK